MAKKKTGGSTTQHRGRVGKRLGLKISGGQQIKTGQIIMRQRGTLVHPGDGVGVGRDHTLFALKDGIVHFFTLRGKKLVSIKGADHGSNK